MEHRVCFTGYSTYLFKDITGVADCIGPEEYPDERDEQKCDDNIDADIEPVNLIYSRSTVYFRSYFLGEDCKNKIETMYWSPDNKGPVGAMPETAHQEYKKQVEVIPWHRDPVATKRYV